MILLGIRCWQRMKGDHKSTTSDRGETISGRGVTINYSTFLPLYNFIHQVEIKSTKHLTSLQKLCHMSGMSLLFSCVHNVRSWLKIQSGDSEAERDELRSWGGWLVWLGLRGVNWVRMGWQHWEQSREICYFASRDEWFLFNPIRLLAEDTE